MSRSAVGSTSFRLSTELFVSIARASFFPFKILELKIYIATLNLAFYLSETPAALSGHRATVQVTKAPDQTYVAPAAWK